MSTLEQQQPDLVLELSASSIFLQHVDVPSQQERPPGQQQLLDMGQTILSLLPSLGVTLATFDNLTAEGWKLGDVSRKPPDPSVSQFPKAIFASKQQRTHKTPTFITDAYVDSNCITLASLVREFDAGSLAGQLHDFRVHSSSVAETVVEYDSVLPWPMTARHLCVNMLFGVHSPDDGSPQSLLILGRDCVVDQQQSQAQQPEAQQEQQQQQGPQEQQQPQEPGLHHAIDCGPEEADSSTPGTFNQRTLPPGQKHKSVKGNCYFSLYVITPLGQGVCRFQRAINVNMHLKWIPSAVMTSMMLQRFKKDLQGMRERAARFPTSEFERRTKSVPFYALLDSILASP